MSKHYCPDWTKEDFLYGDYHNEKYSWYRVALHKCDKDKRICEDDTAIDKYFRENILVIDLLTHSSDLLNYEKKWPIKQKKKNIRYSVRQSSGITVA